MSIALLSLLLIDVSFLLVELLSCSFSFLHLGSSLIDDRVQKVFPKLVVASNFIKTKIISSVSQSINCECQMFVDDILL